ncbi:MAG: hypothetical protein LAT75_10870 [Candidatus Cyclonatronum sp.]|uniref:hypothetical protein n=1 Tax=Cyclonatronum sp. TaxID=3024185 RepID=UPI0025BC8599|nr:hypothetical protein [Cyclonatronum sp.]MCH8487356.1 hypothetical protein [Cyclonatronum sp.]
MADWQTFLDWFMGLGEPYGVNPVIFGSIYVGAVPFFWLAMAWLARNIKRKKPVTGPVLMASACAVSAYVYLIIAGENVPAWVYVFIVAIIVYAIWSTLRKARLKMKQAAETEIQGEMQPKPAADPNLTPKP